MYLTLVMTNTVVAYLGNEATVEVEHSGGCESHGVLELCQREQLHLCHISTVPMLGAYSNIKTTRIFT